MTVNTSTLPAAVAAIRLLNPDLLESGYYADSICGVTPKNYMDDIGECVLTRIRKLTSTLFDTEVICENVSVAVLAHLRKSGQNPRKRGRHGKGTDATNMDKAALRILSLKYAGVNKSIERSDGFCWRAVFREHEENLGSSTLSELFLLFKFLLQGPATQFTTRAQLPSIFRVASARERGRSAVLDMLSELNSSDLRDQDNIMRWFRLLRGGLFSASECELVVPGILSSIGRTLYDVAKCVEKFYKFYDVERSFSASKYATSWKTTNYLSLRQAFLDLPSTSSRTGNSENCYSKACRTGIFFPGYDQVRPLPFNDEMQGGSAADESIFGVCSKSYVQQNKSFTPGALTFCCSCSNPITMGMKVLERHEGPRAILDVLISRFPKLPRHVIYDFGCGL